MILARYFMRKFLIALGASAGFLLLFSFLLQLERYLVRLTELGVSPATAVQLVALSTPNQIYDMIPAIVGVSALWFSYRTSAVHEMTAVRAAGTSGIAVLVVPALTSFVIGLIVMTVFGPISAGLSKSFEQRFSQLRGEQNQVFLESGGFLWFRQILDGRQTILRAAQTNRGVSFSDLHVTIFDPDGNPSQRIIAERAELVENIAKLTSSNLFDFTAPADQVPGMCLYDFKSYNLSRNPQSAPYQAQIWPIGCFETGLTASQVNDSFDLPELVTFWQLPEHIRLLEKSGFSAVKHRLHFHLELAQPLLLAAMALVGGAFTFRQQYGINAVLAALAATLCILAVIFIQEFARILGEVETIHYLIVAWAPPLAALLTAVGLISFREGK